MRLFIVTLALVLGLSSGSAVAGGFRTGDQLYQGCEKGESKTENVAYGECYGYVKGMFDAMTSSEGKLLGFTMCSPGGVSGRQVRDIVFAWLKKNPQHRHYPAPGLVAAALEEAWPCPK
jgi:hypothetical protein